MTQYPPLAPPTPQKTSRSRVVLILVVAVFAMVPCCGVFAAIAIPAFLRSVKRSKSAEAQQVVTRLAYDIKAHTERSGSDQADRCAFPPALPPTSSPVPCAGKTSAVDPAAAQVWKDAGIAPPKGPQYFSYSTRILEEGKGYEIIAKADFDCEGEQHTLTQTLTLEENCQVATNPAITLHELE